MIPSINLCSIMTIPDPKKHQKTLVSSCDLLCQAAGLCAQNWVARREDGPGRGGACSDVWWRIWGYSNYKWSFFCMVKVEFLHYFWVDALQLSSTHTAGFLGFSALDWICFDGLLELVWSQSENNPIICSDFLLVFALGMNQNWSFRPHSPNWMKAKSARKPMFAYIHRGLYNSRKQDS